MGGLVARYWVGVLGGWRVCRAMITLGTPHRGAPKALNWMVNGASLGPRQLGHLTELIRAWPSVAELLPRYPMIWDEASGCGRYPSDLPIGWLQTCAQEAARVHADMELAWTQVPRQRPEVAVRLGWSHPTQGSATWDGTRLKTTKTQPSWLPLSGWAEDQGDGTVPALAAVPSDMDGHSPAEMRVRQRHGPLGAARFVTDMIGHYERWAPLTPVRGDLEPPAAIGLDLDDAYMMGDPVKISASIRPAHSDNSGATVWASLRRADASVPIRDERLCWDAASQSFSGQMLPPQPGLYNVSVTARGIPGTDDLDVSDSIAVFAT